MGKKKIFVEEVLKISPKASTKIVKILTKEYGKEHFNHLRRFSVQYANDTGKYPPC